MGGQRRRGLQGEWKMGPRMREDKRGRGGGAASADKPILVNLVIFIGLA